MVESSTVDIIWYTKESLKGAFPHWIPEEKRLVIVMQLYSAYFDESGTDKMSDIVAVAGFVSNVPNWVEFSREWASLLKIWGIPLFHMSDFENYQSYFKEWSRDEHEKRLTLLIEIINKYTFQSISYAIKTKQFDEIMTDKAKNICGDAYGFACMACYHNLVKIAKQWQNDAYIDYTMESGCKGAGALLRIHGKRSKERKWVENTRINSLTFKDKQDFLPLQAADILAYEIYKEAKRQFMGGERKERWTLGQLRKPGLNSWHYAGDAELKEANDFFVSLPDGFLDRRMG